MQGSPAFEAAGHTSPFGERVFGSNDFSAGYSVWSRILSGDLFRNFLIVQADKENPGRSLEGCCVVGSPDPLSYYQTPPVR